MQITPPTVLNGLPVVRTAVCARNENVTVMVADSEAEKIIVATWWPDLGSSWSWGHYHHGEDRQAEADADFAETAARNSRR